MKNAITILTFALFLSFTQAHGDGDFAGWPDMDKVFQR
jgi:hypothetical protein